MLYFTDTQILEWLSRFWWPFLRIDGLLMAAPLFGAGLVPIRVRILFSAAIALMLVPVLPEPPAVTLFSYQGFLFSLNEILIGASMGFMVQMVFEAVVVAGQTIAMSMGLGFAMMVDQQRGVSVPVISQYFLIIVTLLFLGFNGHLMMFSLAFDSFQYLPTGFWHLQSSGFLHIAQWGGQMFVHALHIALPAVISLLIVQFSFGVMSRAAPSLNLFAVGFPVIMVMGFLIIQLTLPSLGPNFEAMANDAFDLISRLYRQ